MALSRRGLLRGAGISVLATAGVLSATELTGAAGNGPAVTGEMAAPPDWNALRRHISGLIRPGEQGFEQAKLGFNPIFDRKTPAAIARCVNADEVSACVSAVAGRVPIAARSGGHSYGGYSTPDNGLLVDVGPMNQVLLRPDGTVVIGAGAKLRDVYTALSAAGRCLPAGSCPTVGISGLTLGGGLGVLTRKYGLTCDHLLTAEVVTADGRIRTASANSEPDLYWALRGGGGGNFGIVTSFTFSTVPAPELTVFSLKFPPGSAPAVFAAWQRWLPSSVPELWSNLKLSGGDPGGVRVGGCFVGTPAGLQPLLDALVAKAGVQPTTRLVQPKKYLEAMDHFAGSSQRQSFVASSRILAEPVRDPARLTDLLRPHKGMDAIFDGLGGAVSTVDPGATAFPHRKALATVQLYSSVARGEEQARRKAINEVAARMSEQGINGGYVNYIDPAQPQWAQAYYGPNLTRLQHIARAYDPGRVFAFPQGV